MSFAYATLLIGESYLPGVLTLGNRLKQLGTKHKLLILLVVSSISLQSKQLIESIYDELIPIDNQLILSPLQKLSEQLQRQELSISYSKILLWNQLDYDSIVYLDADVLPLQNLDRLFIDYDVDDNQIGAASDSGWPDIFNSGVFKLKPNKQTFEQLLEFSVDPNNTFDGGDQGLFNEYFKLENWIRLPYLYNVTPNYRQDYQYLPAFNRFFKDIKVLHFIGQVKPWHYENVLASDLANFHQYWWDEFNKLIGDDVALKYTLLNLPRGEATKLKFGKTVNAWDKKDIEQDTELVEEEEEEEEVVSHSPIFPWEHRQEKRQPTRVFQNIPTTSTVGNVSGKSGTKEEQELDRSTETLKRTHIS